MSEPTNPYEPPRTNDEGAWTPRSNHEELAGTVIGLKIIYFSILFAVLCVIGIGISAAVVPVAVVPLSYALRFAFLMLVIGPFFCLMAPQETGARGLIMGSTACQLIGLVIGIASTVGIAIPEVIAMSRMLFMTIGLALFVLFMMKIASYLQRDDLRKEGITLLIASLTLFAILLVIGIVADAIGLLVWILGFVAGIGVLLVFVMYANLVNALYKAIETAQR